MLALVLCAPVVTAAASLQELAQRLLPQATVGAVEPTPIPNLYKVPGARTLQSAHASYWRDLLEWTEAIAIR